MNSEGLKSCCASVCTVVAAVAIPVLVYIALLCGSGSRLIEIPSEKKTDAAVRCDILCVIQLQGKKGDGGICFEFGGVPVAHNEQQSLLFYSPHLMGEFDALISGSSAEIVMSLLSSGDIQGAVTALEFFKKHKIEYNDLENNLGCLYYCLGDYSTAASLFENQSHEDKARALINLACCHFALGNIEKCKEVLSSTKSMYVDEESKRLYNRILACLRGSIDPSDLSAENVEDQFCLARMYYDENLYSKAISVLSRILPLADAELQSTVFSFIGRCFFEQRNYKDSLLYSSRSSNLLPSQIISACCMHEMGDIDNADFAMYNLRHLENDIVENNRCVFTNGCGGNIVWSTTKSASSRYNLGSWFLREKRYIDVMNLYSTDEELCQDEIFIKANALIGLAGESDLELVQTEYLRKAKTLLQTIHDDDLSTVSEGIIAFIDHDYITALKCWENHDRVGNYNIGICLANIGRWPDAIEKFIDAPYSDLRSFWLVRCYIQTVQTELAYRECYENPSLWTVAGSEHVAMGRFVEGFDCFLNAVGSSADKHCLQGLNDCTKSLFRHVIETGKMHAELDLLVNQLKGIKNNPEGIKIVTQIEEWINQHLS